MNELMVGGAMGGDSGGSGSSTPIDAPDSIRSMAYVEIVEAWSWGEIEGFPEGEDPLRRIYLDGTPIISSTGAVNFKGVTFDYRTGTQDQTYIPGTVGDAVSDPTIVNVPVVHDTPIIKTIVDPAIDAIDVLINFAGLVKIDPNSGDTSAPTVQLSIEVRVDSGSWVEADLGGRDVIRAVTHAAYQRSYHINLREFAASAAAYDIRVSRVSADPDSNETSAFNWYAINNLTYVKLRRPNVAHCRIRFDSRYFSQVPARSYLLRGWRFQVPNAVAYNPITRTYTGSDWDGTFVKSWSRNPAWFLYALLTTPGAGLGAHINPAYLDKWTLYTIAKRCDELVPDGFGGQEPRYSIDYFFATKTNAIDLVQAIAGVFDSQALWDGQTVYVTQDAPKPVAGLFMPANVKSGRFTYAGTSRQVRYTAAMIQYSDPRDQYRLQTEYVEDLAGIERYGFRPKTEAAIGVISRGQAHRHGNRLLMTSRVETDSVTFSVGLTSISNRPGDVIRIADPLRSSGARRGGRISSGSTATSINLDANVTLASSVSYRLAIIAPDGTVDDSAVTSSPGTHSSLVVSPAFSEAPAAEMEFILYDPNVDNALFRILQIKDNDDLSSGIYTVVAVQYQLTKYSAIDSIANFESPPISPYIVQQVLPPSGLQANEGVYTALEGLIRYIDISWSASNDKMLRGYHLVITKDGVSVFSGEVTDLGYRLKNPLVGIYVITISTVNIVGKYSTSLSINYTLGEMYPITSVSVTGLALKTGGSSFAGRNAEMVWDTNAIAVLGFSATYASGTGGQSPWFRDFQVDVYNGTTLLRSDFVTESAYNYTYDKNLQDGGPRRTITFTVRARDYFGRYSTAMSATVSNPAPAAIAPANLTISNAYQSLIVNYIPPSDNDFVGVILFLSTSTGFTPVPGNRVYIGGNNPITLTDLTDGVTYYLRISTYDAFGGASDSTLSTTEYNHVVSPVSAAMSPASIQAGLQTALNTDANALVFDASNFAVRLSGANTTPFIIGSYGGSPAILMDASVVVTGPLSASQLKSGTLDASQTITIGDGHTVLNGDGSIICYNGDSSISHRDFAMLNAGDITFQKYKGGAYQTYKSLRRVEYGTAVTGSTVTLPGYWDSQPNIQVTPNALKTFDATQSSQSLTWQIRADNLRETSVGSGVWQFDAVAQLTYSAASGSKTVSSINSGGASGSYSWTSAADALPAGTISVTPVVNFSTVRGNGSSTYGFYYRSVNWKIQALVGSSWTDVSGASKVRNILQSEHGNVITDTMATNLPSGATQIRVVFTASDTNGASYSQGADYYNLGQDAVSSNGASASATAYQSVGSSAAWHNNSPVTLTSAPYTTPSGWEIYSVNYAAQWEQTSTWSAGTDYGYSNGNYISTTYSGPVVGHDSGIKPAVSTGAIATTSFDQNFWKANADKSVHVLTTTFTLSNPTAIVYRRQLVTNSAVSLDNFTFVSYSWNISGSTNLAPGGSLNWIAVGN